MGFMGFMVQGSGFRVQFKVQRKAEGRRLKAESEGLKDAKAIVPAGFA
jgi:hypothetical protein